jgi:hypothetical protein
MIQEIINQWEANKHKLCHYFTKNHPGSYEEIVKKIFELVIVGYDAKKITKIDDGDYQGTQIFLIPKDTYQPDISNYIFTHTYYGSCSGCDTLKSIQGFQDNDNPPNQEEVQKYMTLALHLVQKLKQMTGDDHEVQED